MLENLKNKRRDSWKERRLGSYISRRTLGKLGCESLAVTGFLPHVSCQVALTHDSYDYMIRGLGTAAGACSHPQQDALTRRMAGIHVNLVPTEQDRDMTEPYWEGSRSSIGCSVAWFKWNQTVGSEKTV